MNGYHFFWICTFDTSEGLLISRGFSFVSHSGLEHPDPLKLIRLYIRLFVHDRIIINLMHIMAIYQNYIKLYLPPINKEKSTIISLFHYFNASITSSNVCLIFVDFILLGFFMRSSKLGESLTIFPFFLAIISNEQYIPLMVSISARIILSRLLF